MRISTSADWADTSWPVPALVAAAEVRAAGAVVAPPVVAEAQRAVAVAAEAQLSAEAAEVQPVAEAAEVRPAVEVAAGQQLSATEVEVAARV